MPSHKFPPHLIAAAIAQLLDEQRAVLAELQNQPGGYALLPGLLAEELVRERIGWLEEELALRLSPGLQ
jgi:hypothetical protein